MRKALLVTVLVLIAVPSMFAQAVTTVNPANNVNVTVSEQCSIATFGLAFPAYDPFGAAVTQTAPISVTCTKGTVATVTMGTGANASGAVRRMLDTVSGDFLTYEVYLDAAMTTVWNTVNTKGGTAASKNTPVSLRFGVEPVDNNAYGRVAANQDVTPGTYNDTLQATVNF
jgi:spore coat protein U-like protein